MYEIQNETVNWAIDCFGEKIVFNKKERNARFLEEALELVQCLGASREMAHSMVDYVFDRPAGEKWQEVGGAIVTLATLCEVHNIELIDAWRGELDRIKNLGTQIKAKNLEKPKYV